MRFVEIRMYNVYTYIVDEDGHTVNSLTVIILTINSNKKGGASKWKQETLKLSAN